MGRTLPTNAAINIVLTDDNTQVNTNTIALSLDGATVTPNSISQAINADSTLNTMITCAPSVGFAYGTSHSVSVTFADNATPTPNTTTLQYGFTVIANYTTLLFEGFESYQLGAIDADLSGGPNAAASGSGGNPWFGPLPPNLHVVVAQDGVTPISGNQMVTGSGINYDGDQDWYNLSYRFNGGRPFRGNVMLDWWFYDPNGAGDSSYQDYIALVSYPTMPTNTDYPAGGNLNSGLPTLTTNNYQRLIVGGDSVQSAGYDSTKYQMRVVFAPDGYSGGWFNSPVTRTAGWHHARFIVEAAQPVGTSLVDIYIDNLVNPVDVEEVLSITGFNGIEMNADNATSFAYYDDMTFAQAMPGTLTATLSGANVLLNWTGPFVLQSASNVQGPYTDVPGGVLVFSPYAYSVGAAPAQFFRLRN